MYYCDCLLFYTVRVLESHISSHCLLRQFALNDVPSTRRKGHIDLGRLIVIPCKRWNQQRPLNPETE